MARTDVVVIGAGPAGLAMSWHLARAGVDHVVLERRRVAEAWRSERWDSLRTLTPRWLTRLPGLPPAGGDPDGFLSKDEVTALIATYARSFGAPVVTDASVRSVVAAPGGYRVRTLLGEWSARSVVIATGAAGTPRVPWFARSLGPAFQQLTPTAYRNPDQLRPGGVLVVGASASGAQIARELALAGREVTLAVGRHTRVPRTWRGRDITWWLDRTGAIDRPWHQVPDPRAPHDKPSLQLIGTDAREDLDLGTLSAAGVDVVDRVVGAAGSDIALGRGLGPEIARSDAAMHRLLDRLDAFADRHGLDLPFGLRPRPIRVPTGRPHRLDLRDRGIRAVVWATGFRTYTPWLHVGVLDRAGAIVHDGGVTAAPGLYAIGLRNLRRQRSTWIDGFGGDAAALSAHLLDELHGRRAVAC